jgi:hypothetical protein
MFPVTEFTSRFPAGMVDWVDGPEIELSRDTLPADTRTVVLKSSVVEYDLLEN